MKNLFLIIIIVFAGLNPAVSQTIYEGDVIFDSQEEIDSFIIKYPKCTIIDGSVIIREENVGDFYNVSGLKNIERITGALTIEDNKDLTSLSGLISLTYVGRGVEIDNNKSLYGFSGLDALERIGGDLAIYNNESVTCLSGFSSIDSIYGTLSISLMPDLISLDGLNGLSFVGNCLLIQNNPKLLDIQNLNQLKSIYGFVEILGNSSLMSLKGLDFITSIGSYLKIMNNGSLKNLAGLTFLRVIGENGDDLRNRLTISDNNSLITLAGMNILQYIGGSIDITYNPSLTKLDGFYHLDSIKGSINIVGNDKLNNISSLSGIDPNTVFSPTSSYKALEIHENPQLSECAIRSICHIINDDDKSKNIHDNKAGCNSIYEISDACSVVGVMSPEADDICNFRISPNPAKNILYLNYDKVTVSDPESIRVEIYSAAGQKMISFDHIQEKINISDLSQWLYLIKFITAQRTVTRKIIVAR